MSVVHALPILTQHKRPRRSGSPLAATASRFVPVGYPADLSGRFWEGMEGPWPALEASADLSIFPRQAADSPAAWGLTPPRGEEPPPRHPATADGAMRCHPCMQLSYNPHPAGSRMQFTSS